MITAKRVSSLQPSPIVTIADKIRTMQAEGHKVLNLVGGDPNFNTPAHIRHAATAALESGFTHYDATAGALQLRKAVAELYARKYGLEYNPNSEILITTGAKSALYEIFLATVDPGDKVMLLDPCYPSYEPMIDLIGGEAVHVTLDKKDNFQVTRERLESAYDPQVKLIVVNSPNNPTGRVLSRTEIEVICEFATRRNVYIISDEIYEELVYDGEHICLASLPGMRERVIIVSGCSKTFAMTGWRIGYLLGHRPLVEAVTKVHSNTVTHPTTFAQSGAVAALRGDYAAVLDMAAAYRARRDELVPLIRDIDGLDCPMPEGAFYLMIDHSAIEPSSLRFAQYLLDEALIGATPGIVFGDAGEGFVRISIATDRAVLLEAVQRIGAAVAKLRGGQP